MERGRKGRDWMFVCIVCESVGYMSVHECVYNCVCVCMSVCEDECVQVCV